MGDSHSRKVVNQWYGRRALHTVVLGFQTLGTHSERMSFNNNLQVNPAVSHRNFLPVSFRPLSRAQSSSELLAFGLICCTLDLLAVLESNDSGESGNFVIFLRCIVSTPELRYSE
jgi:hypothetical protein